MFRDEEAHPHLESAQGAAGTGIAFTRRRLALVVGGLFALWLVGVFARQVGEASAAASQADQLRARNAAMEQDVESLRLELELIQNPAFVAQVSRGYLLGAPGEVAFAVDPTATLPGPDAPGSQGIKPETTKQNVSPLESWLEVLFGSQ
jgi:hypothetical protein